MESKYKGRIKRITNWQNLLQYIQGKLANDTILLTLDYLKTEIFENPQHHPLPCAMYWVDISLLLILYVLDYKSQKEVESQFNVPHSTYAAVTLWGVNKVIFST